MSGHRFRALALLLGWFLGLGAVLVSLGWLDQGQLRLPARTEEAWALWFATASPVVMVLAAARALAFVFTGVLLAWTLAVVIVNAMGARRFQRIRSGIPFFDRAVRNVVGVTAVITLAGTITAPSAEAAAPVLRLAPESKDSWPVLRHAPTASNTPTSSAPTTTAPVPPSTTSTLAPTSTTTPAAAPTLPAATGSPESWTIRSGDTLWAVATATLTARQLPVGDREVEQYLRQIVSANQTVLANPNDPDLVYPGQIFRLPR